ncbi:hypothetical protein E4T48_07030 [Aureobasidium sp. EXF-10727]|nr:hypothetical protein E4T48_07030 [Aureobasidium sp. EXF-10727]KAI4725029.1 hypothetical protein E4T49_07263 [Aureobasidium sp. EXF-10728]
MSSSHPTSNQDLTSERPGTSAGGSSPVSAGSPTSPNMGPVYHSPEMHPPHSHAEIQQEAHGMYPRLQRRLTNTYEQALRDRAAATGEQQHIDDIGLAIRSDADGPDAPPALYPGRKPSFKLSDQKRAAMEHIFNNDPRGPGYTTSAPKK